jgi:aspartate/methionine/tyrosine aminotransferase
LIRFSDRVPRRLEPNRWSRALARAGDIPVDLTLSNPTRCELPYPDDLLEPLASVDGLWYRPSPRGPAAARTAIAELYREWNADVDAERVVLTASTSEAYSMLFRLLTDPGETVIVPTPSYPLFDQLTRLDGIAAHPLSLDPDDDWRPRLDNLGRAPESTRAVVVVHPNNPTGSFIHPDDAAALEHRCRERGWALIADEVFLPFAADGGAGQDQSFADRQGGLCFTLGGFSKMLGLPQLKLAWIVVGGPDSVVDPALDRLDHIADAALSVGTPVASAAPELLRRAAPIRDAVITRCRRNLAHLRHRTDAVPSITIPRVGGGWSVPIRLPAVLDDDEFALRLLDRGVAVQPGYLFDLPFECSVVLSLLTPEAVWDRGLEIFTTAVGELTTADTG